MTPAKASDLKYTVMDFDQLEGWAEDDHAAALRVFLNTCQDMKDVDWRALCRFAQEARRRSRTASRDHHRPLRWGPQI